MGSFCKSSPQVTQTEQKYTADPRVSASADQVLSMAQSAASRPFETPAAPVAGFTPFQDQAYSQIMGMQGGTDPYFANAAAGIGQAGTPVTQSEIASYMNPFADQAMASMKKYVFDPQRRNTMGQGRQMAGGVGADRLALTSQNLDKTQSDALSGAQAGFYSNAMQQAQRAKEMALASGQGWANLGVGKQNAGLQATQALMGAGNQQQGQAQAELMSPYMQELARIAYPMQQASFLSGVTGDMSNVLKGSQSGTQTVQASQPSPLNQIAGLGMSAAGLAMGNPWMAMGGMGNMFGGSAGVPQNTTSLNANYAPFGSTYFSKRGGAITRAGGGAVNPWDAARGFYDGGFTGGFEDRWSPVPEAITSGDFDPQGNNFNPTGYGLNAPPTEASIAPPQNPFASIPEGQGFRASGQAPPNAMAWDDLNAPIQPKPVQTESIPRTGYLKQTQTVPQITVNPASRPPIHRQEPPPPPVPPQRVPVNRPTPTPDPSINGEVTQDGIFMPRSMLPYPDSTKRDWGQQMARSPWMSLTAAGAKMMQSTQSGLGGLGAGIEAGVGHLDKQRKELRSEEEINQRAELLYRQSKSELDKYTKMTPYQKAMTERSQYKPTGMTTEEGHPVLYNSMDGSTINGVTGEAVPQGTKLIGKPGGRGKTVFEMKREAYLSLNPGDETGALNYANGKTMLSHGQLANLAAQRAAQDVTANSMIFSEADREAFRKQRLKYWLDYYQGHNTMTSPGGAGASPGP